jgi:hypothetical protein
VGFWFQSLLSKCSLHRYNEESWVLIPEDFLGVFLMFIPIIGVILRLPKTWKFLLKKLSLGEKIDFSADADATADAETVDAMDAEASGGAAASGQRHGDDDDSEAEAADEKPRPSFVFTLWRVFCTCIAFGITVTGIVLYGVAVHRLTSGFADTDACTDGAFNKVGLYRFRNAVDT